MDGSTPTATRSPIGIVIAVGAVLLIAALPLRLNAQDARLSSATTEQLGADYRRMHAAYSHRTPGVLDPALDVWGGAFHMVISELGRRLGASRPHVREVVRLMGAPDGRRPAPITNLVDGHGCDDILVYDWRGGHDFLYFCVVRDVVVRSDWWMAGE